MRNRYRRLVIRRIFLGKKQREGRLTVVAEESFGFFVLCWHEASYKVVSDGSQQDHQEDNLSLMDRQREREKGRVSTRYMLHDSR